MVFVLIIILSNAVQPGFSRKNLHRERRPPVTLTIHRINLLSLMLSPSPPSHLFLSNPHVTFLLKLIFCLILLNICIPIRLTRLNSPLTKGRVTFPNRMNFRKSSKRPLTPPIFGKLYCAFRDKIVTKVRMFIWRHCCVLYDPISHEMHVVQMFNMVIG